MTVKHSMSFLCIVLIIVMFIQCGRKESAQSGESKIIVAYPGDETIFNHEYWGYEATYLMFIPLFDWDEFGDLQPALAERWEHSPDYREWTYYLRKDVRWHDGMPVTAHDIKFSMDMRAKLKGHESAVEVIDDYTCRVIFNRPKDVMNTYDLEAFYPKHLLENLDLEDFYEWDFWSHPVGNGPYRYVRHMPKIMVELEANPEYFRGKPKIDRVVLKFTNNIIPELMSGSIDAAEFFDRSDVLKLKGDDRFRSYYFWANQVTSIYWNHNHPLFRNKEIRRALTMAINRVELSGLLNYPDDVPILDTITTWRQFRKGVYPDPLPNDPDQARKILEKHGWRDTNGDGIREREGKEFHFSALISSSLPGSKESAIYVQDQFRRIGVRMEIQLLDELFIMQRIQTGDFEALFFVVEGTLTHPRYGDAKLFGKESPLGYKNPEIIRLLDMALLEMDPDKLDSIYKKIMPIFVEDMPMTFLLPQVFSTIAHRRIKGLKNLERIFPIGELEHLWIEEKE